VLRRTYTGGPVLDRAGGLLALCKQVFDRLEGRILEHSNADKVVAIIAYVREILDRIEWQFTTLQRYQIPGAGQGANRITVGSGLCEFGHADCGRCSRTIEDNDRLTEMLFGGLGQNASGLVRAAASGPR